MTPRVPVIFECVVNVSEGRDERRPRCPGRRRRADPARPTPRPRPQPVRPDPGRTRRCRGAGRQDAGHDHGGHVDLRRHQGAHPRLGVLDVVPFVPYQPGRPAPDDLEDAVALRDDFARWLAAELGVPASSTGRFRAAGPGTCRTAAGPPSGRKGPLPRAGSPTSGRPQPDPRSGATAVGARRVLVAYNVWVSSAEVARRVAPLVRGPHVRALGLAVGPRAQVSCNLLDPGVPRPGHGSTTSSRPWSPRPAGRWRGRSWSASSPRPCWPPSRGNAGTSSAWPRSRTVEARLGRRDGPRRRRQREAAAR